MVTKLDDKTQSLKIRLSPQEIAEAIRGKAQSPKKESFYFPGKGSIKYSVILDQAKRILELNHLGSWSKLDDETFIRRLGDAIPRLKIFQPVEEEIPSSMENTAPELTEEEPLTMSDKAPSNPLGSFPASNEQASQPITPRRVITPALIPSTRAEIETEKVKLMEEGTMKGAATEKIDKMRQEEGPATKKINAAHSTDNPLTRTSSPIGTPAYTEPKRTEIAHEPASVKNAPSATRPIQTNPPSSIYPKNPAPFTGRVSASIKNFRIPYPVTNSAKNLFSRAGRFFKSNFGKFLTPGNISRLGAALVGGFGGMGIAGAAGSATGALGGFFAPEILKSGGSRLLGAAASRGAGGFASLSSRARSASGRFSQTSSSIKKSSAKKIIFLLLGLFFIVSFTVSFVSGVPPFAGSQSQPNQSSSGNTRSSQVTTPSSCPVPNGTINCGSQMTPVNGPLGLCGHCGTGYTSSKEIQNCQNYPENKYSIDIGTTASQAVFLPTINNNNISWRFVAEQPGGTGYIQIFAGEDASTQEKYSLQIHHTESGSGNPGNHRSGDRAATACSTCGAGHVHVQLRSDSTGSWLDAAQILCK